MVYLVSQFWIGHLIWQGSLQINLTQDRTQDEFAHSGIYFPPPVGTSST
jgi:hypothetical protein